MTSVEGWVYHSYPFHHQQYNVITRQLYWIRYVDWIITTPIILLVLMVIAGASCVEILFAAIADVVLILVVCHLIL